LSNERIIIIRRRRSEKEQCIIVRASVGEMKDCMPFQEEKKKDVYIYIYDKTKRN